MNAREANEIRSLAQLDQLIAQANHTRRTTRRVVIFVLLAAALLVGFNWPKPAEAAPRPVFKGTVTIVVSNTTKSDPYGQYLNTKLWNLPAAAKAAGIGKYRITTTKYANDPNVWGHVYVRSIKSQSRVADVYKLVDFGQLLESQVTMSDSRGAKLTAAQRHNELVKALKAATPR